MPTSYDAAWLEKLHDKFVEAFLSNDIAALGACYTDDAVLLPPGRAIVSGRDAIVEFWQSSEHIQGLVFEATSTKMMLGDTVLREAGNLLLTSRGQGRETWNTAAKYVAVWLLIDGVWKLDSTIWNGASGGAGGGRRRRRGGPGGGGGRQGGGPGGGGGGGRQGGGGGRQGGGAGGGGRQGGGPGGGGRLGAGAGRQGGGPRGAGRRQGGEGGGGGGGGQAGDDDLG